MLMLNDNVKYPMLRIPPVIDIELIFKCDIYNIYDLLSCICINYNAFNDIVYIKVDIYRDNVYI